MSWKKYFKPAVQQHTSPTTRGAASVGSQVNSWLPETYAGPPNRLERYMQYEQMDLDHEVHSALDTLAEFSTQVSPLTKTPFKINYTSDPTPHESNIISEMLISWSKLNKFNQRMFRIFRSTLMYGDQFFIRNPETYELLWVDPNKVQSVTINENRGKKITSYAVKDIDLNLVSQVATNQTDVSSPSFGFPVSSNNRASYGTITASGQRNHTSTSNAIDVDATHVVHLSLSEGVDSSWPFGNSVLESIYKVYKQKELLEDAMLIYRIHRAPERRVFFIDVGNMPPAKAQAYLEKVKRDIQQKRIPNRNGQGVSVADARYNPLSTLEDYFFATSADSRGSKIETLPGGDNLGQIDDLKYFNNKMLRALGIPSSYLPTGPEDGSASFNDGKVGTAFIQEFRFTERCKRHQTQLVPSLDLEFKLFLKGKGISIDNSLFSLDFNDPQNFSKYRELDILNAQVNTYNTVSSLDVISKRFALKKYLGLTEQEILENERLYAEEKGIAAKTSPKSSSNDLRDLGVTSSGIEGIPDDEEMPDEEMPLDDEEMPDDAEVEAPSTKPVPTSNNLSKPSGTTPPSGIS